MHDGRDDNDRMSDIQLPDPQTWSGAVRVSHLGVVLAEGADAATFLHGQFSQDMASQTADEARLAAYCSAKGRMLASLLTLRPTPETFWLLTDREVLPGLVKRLSMFVLRAKARLSDVSAQVVVVGLVGRDVAESLDDAATGTPGSVRVHAGGHLIRLADVLGVPRWCWVGPVDAAEVLTAGLPALPESAWQWLDVMSGIPHIAARTVDQFVPQMVNFELVGGVNFQKGCYPGQEVVARSQYRGTTKRRAFIAHATAPLEPGAEVFSADDPGQPAGMVINAAPMPTIGDAQAGFSALIELKLAAADKALFAGSANGVALQLGTLPYSLPSAE
jgi:folate-binding protein YgfZ